MAGILAMPWTRILVFNFLGPFAWVTTIASIGYFFGDKVVSLSTIIMVANAQLLRRLKLQAAVP